MHTDTYELLSSLVGAAGVSGNESAVAEVIRRELVSAGIVADAVYDDRMGNHWIHLGPQGQPQRLLMAHMDEIGLRITAIREDGICRVAAVGGIDPQLWEGTPVVVHTAGGPVPGCISPVSHHVTYRTSLGPKTRIGIEELLLDVGASSREQAESMGVTVFDTVTWPKQLVRLGDELVQGRSLDDRFGCCAQLMAVRQLVAAGCEVPTVIAWTVQEELGLRGARALARRFNELQEVIAVDSFTVGTGPRDNRQFDNVWQGRGPVLRCWDSTTMVPDTERRAITEKLGQSGIVVQSGHMPGGNDASVFESGTTRSFGLSVALQYSHSQSERIHLGDLEQLAGLLAWWCATGTAL